MDIPLKIAYRHEVEMLQNIDETVISIEFLLVKVLVRK